MNSEIRLARLADAPEIGRLHVQVWNQTYRGLMPDAVLDGMSMEERSAAWHERLLESEQCGIFATFLAILNDEPVGFAACGAQRDAELRAAGFTSEFQVINIHEKAQGMGLGRRLMHAMAQTIIDRNHRAASVWVIRDRPPARRFYERMGGTLQGEKIEKRLDLNIAEVSYVWSDVALVPGRSNT